MSGAISLTKFAADAVSKFGMTLKLKAADVPPPPEFGGVLTVIGKLAPPAGTVAGIAEPGTVAIIIVPVKHVVVTSTPLTRTLDVGKKLLPPTYSLKDGKF